MFRQLDLLPFHGENIETLMINRFPYEELISVAGQINQPHLILRSRDGAVGIATSYGLDDRGVGVRVPVESRIISTSF
jgi:hypothetical protein